MTNFIPEYLDIDYNTYISKLQGELEQSDVFRDYDYEGSNISILLELMAYFGDINTYFINKIAKNVYMETADIYECVNRLARQVGYEPKGIRGSLGTLTATVSGCTPGETVTVKEWKMVNSGRSTDDEEAIIFSTTTPQSTTCGASATSVTFDFDIRQGQVQNLDNYRGSDLIENELILPTDYAYDDDLSDTSPSIEVQVNSEVWSRTDDFYDDLIVETEGDNVYMFVYDRYRRDKILFNSTRNVPEEGDIINLIVLDSLGTDGNIAADAEDDSWSIVNTEFIYGDVTGWFDNSLITLSLSAATTGGASPETITEIKNNSQSALKAQFRNVTKNDYNSHLSSRSDIIKATAWGEQDIAPSGSIENYNVVRISTIPQVWGDSTISTTTGTGTTEWGKTGSWIIPVAYSTAWENELSEYLRDRKMISTYEIFEVPDLVYFSFEFTVRIKRTYSFVDVSTDILNKLIYYFRAENQEFNSIMDFNDVIEYILDTSNTSDDDDFTNIQGIRNLNMRDINANKTIYEPNTDGNYPYYTTTDETLRDNNLRPIQIGLNQFPYLSDDTVQITEDS